MLKGILRKLGFQKDYRLYNGYYLPILKSNENLSDDRTYLESGLEQINFLIKNNLLQSSTKILDFGCGQGRMLNTLNYSDTKYSNYIGLDTSKSSIQWCIKYLQNSSRTNFVHLPAANARYNKKAEGLRPLPFKEQSFDLIFLNSVFSHMLEADIAFYLNEFYKILGDGGHVYLTAFVEDNVPKVEENPDDYLSTNSGALHRVRYNKDYFLSLIMGSSFKVDMFHHHGIERTKQSVFVLSKSK